jgi:hypothetical protein
LTTLRLLEVGIRQVGHYYWVKSELKSNKSESGVSVPNDKEDVRQQGEKVSKCRKKLSYSLYIA